MNNYTHNLKGAYEIINVETKKVVETTRTYTQAKLVKTKWEKMTGVEHMIKSDKTKLRRTIHTIRGDVTTL